jgi:hypothetical protein
MQQITKMAIHRTLEAVRSSQYEKSTKSSELQKQSKRASLEWITRLIFKVELVKQLRPPLTQQQRTELALRLDEMKLTEEQLSLMAESVIRRSTYGTIALEYWIADDIVTQEELVAERLAIRREDERRRRNFENELDDRIRELRDGLRERVEKMDVEREKLLMETLALDDECVKWELQRQEWYKEAEARVRRKLSEYKQQLRLLSESERKEVLDMAVAFKIMRNWDKHVLEHIHLFADKLMPIMEERAHLLDNPDQES